MKEATRKRSYTIPCPSALRDRVTALSRRRRVNVADLARSILLVVPEDVISAFPDPGEPDRADRESVILKSGPAMGRPWRRKPRLQVRMAPGYDISLIRRALGLALAVDQGAMTVRVERPFTAAEEETERAAEAFARDAREELERLRAIVAVLSFEPLPDGVNSRDDALHVLGFPPASIPDRATVRARFRMLATVHHPDGDCGSHKRMSQLNAAMERLRSAAA